MKSPSPRMFGFIGVGIAAAILILVGVSGRFAVPASPPQPVAMAKAGLPGSVSVGGLTLASTNVDFPVEEAVFPDGPNADVINANCAACHSPSMVLAQPFLTKVQWTAEVDKMRDVYKAPVAAADVPAIVAYLTAMSDKLAYVAP